MTHKSKFKNWSYKASKENARESVNDFKAGKDFLKHKKHEQ
jgi:hypothetical protein